MASSNAVHLDWDVFIDGLTLVQGSPVEVGGHKGEGQFLVSAHVHGGISPFAPTRKYRPLENPALFRDFASTDPTPAGILGFANQFGLLLSQRTAFTETGSGKTNHGEPINIWQREISAMHTVTTLWDAINDSDTETLRNYLTLQDDDSLTARYLPPPDSTGVSVEQVVTLYFGGPPLTREPQPIFISTKPTQPSKDGQLAEAALAYIEDIINVYTNDRLGIRMTRQDGRLQLLFEPDGLIGALWYQCARAISQRKTFRACGECSSWFAVSRTNKKKSFCSPACRLKDYRRRVGQAQQLHDQGESIGSIAETLNTDTGTVTGWLTGGSK